MDRDPMWVLVGACAKSLQSLRCYGLYIVLWPVAPLWTAVAPQAPLSTGFSRQENWSELPFPSPGNLFNPGIQSMPWQVESSPPAPAERPQGRLSMGLQTLISYFTDKIYPLPVFSAPHKLDFNAMILKTN